MILRSIQDETIPFEDCNSFAIATASRIFAIEGTMPCKMKGTKKIYHEGTLEAAQATTPWVMSLSMSICVVIAIKRHAACQHVQVISARLMNGQVPARHHIKQDMYEKLFKTVQHTPWAPTDT